MELEDFFSRLALDIIGKAVFNYDFDSLTHDDPVIKVPGSGFWVQGSGCRVQRAGFSVQGSACRVLGAGFWVQGSGCRVQGAGFLGVGCGM